jgi:hypothetical protein
MTASDQVGLKKIVTLSASYPDNEQQNLRDPGFSEQTPESHNESVLALPRIAGCFRCSRVLGPRRILLRHVPDSNFFRD